MSFARRAAALAASLALAACGPSILYSGYSPDRTHRVDVISRRGAEYVEIDGTRSVGYQGVAVPSLAFSPDGRHLAFAARSDRGWTVVIDGRTEPGDDGIGELVVADAGVAYVAERGGTWRVVVDGVAGPAFDAILAGTLSRDADHVAYVARAGDHVHAVIDGVVGPAFDGIGQLVLGAHVAYAARRGADAFAVVDGVASRAWRSVAHLAAERGHVAYAARDGGAWRVVIDGREGPAVDAVRSIVIGADHVAYLARAERHEIVVLDGVPIAAAEQLHALAFSPRGLSYVETSAVGAQVVTEHDRGPPFDEITAPVFAGDRIAYAARRGAVWFAVIDGVETRVGSRVATPMFSGNAHHLGYVGRDDRGSFVNIDGAIYRFDLVIEDTLAFSRDGTVWSIVAGDLSRERLFFAIASTGSRSDRVARLLLSTRELYSTAARSASVDLIAHQDNALAQWSEAEANRAAARRAGGRVSTSGERRSTSRPSTTRQGRR